MRLSLTGLFVILFGIFYCYSKSSSSSKNQIVSVEEKYKRCRKKMFQINDIIEVTGYYVLSGDVLQPSTYLYFYKSENRTDTKEFYIRQHGKLVGVYNIEPFKITFRTQGLTNIHFWAKSIHPECETSIQTIPVPSISNCTVLGRIHNTRLRIQNGIYTLDGKVTVEDRELFYSLREATSIPKDPYEIYYYGASNGIVDNEFHLYIGSNLLPGEYRIWIVLYDGLCVGQTYNYHFEVPQCTLENTKGLISSIQVLDSSHIRVFLSYSSPSSLNSPIFYLYMEPKWMTTGRRTIQYIISKGQSCSLEPNEIQCSIDKEIKSGVDYFFWTLVQEKNCYSQEERSSFILREDLYTVQTFISAPLILSQSFNKEILLIGSLYHLEQHNIKEDVDFNVDADLYSFYNGEEHRIARNIHIHIYPSPSTHSYYYYLNIKESTFQKVSQIHYHINHHFLSFSDQVYSLYSYYSCLSPILQITSIKSLSSHEIKITGKIDHESTDLVLYSSSHPLEDSGLSSYIILQEGTFIATIQQGPFTIHGHLQESTNYIYFIGKYETCLSPLQCYIHTHGLFSSCR